jgi:predicted NBD/HSP70 family sugar kinase
VLLAIDVGNTQTHLGVFSGDRLRHEWRASTEPTRTADELALMFGEFLNLAEMSFSREITGVAISSVVPKATQELIAPGGVLIGRQGGSESRGPTSVRRRWRSCSTSGTSSNAWPSQ